MAKVLINDSTLTNIASAIREKNGAVETYKPSEMPDAIRAISSGSNGIPLPYIIRDVLTYRFAFNSWNDLVVEYGSQFQTENVRAAYRAFYGSDQLIEIPFSINADPNANVDFVDMFYGCYNLESIPHMNGRPKDLSNLFFQCHNLRSIPEDFETWFTWEPTIMGTTDSFGDYVQLGGMMDTFAICRSLRTIPVEVFSHDHPEAALNRTYFNGIRGCYALDEIVNLPNPYTRTLTSSALTYLGWRCERIQNLTFANFNGPVQWKKQTMDLSSANYIGYAKEAADILDYNSGITADKEVTDYASYRALRNDPDWFTCDIAYSRYNHDSAVNTINSLPDCSAYGVNTIKFAGQSGSQTDGGAINTLTEAEIAVATAKGWTVSFE